MPEQSRRSLLKWAAGVLAAWNGILVTVPAVRYLLEALHASPATSAQPTRVARWSELPPGKPTLFPIHGVRRDAWTLHAGELIGRVWLVRDEGDEAPGPEAKVQALSAVCPHLGCTIELATGGEQFLCPCHRAAFALDGQRTLAAGERRNPSPRSMDPLECRVVEGEPGEWWIEVKYEKFAQGLSKRVEKS